LGALNPVCEMADHLSRKHLVRSIRPTGYHSGVSGGCMLGWSTKC